MTESIQRRTLKAGLLLVFVVGALLAVVAGTASAKNKHNNGNGNGNNGNDSAAPVTVVADCDNARWVITSPTGLSSIVYSLDGRRTTVDDLSGDTYFLTVTDVDTIQARSNKKSVRGTGKPRPGGSGKSQRFDVDWATACPQPAVTVELASGSGTVTEGDTLVVEIDRTAGTGFCDVNLVTRDGSAMAGSDYAAQSITLTVGPAVDVSIPIFSDFEAEGTETFTVELQPGGTCALGANSTLQIDITD